MSPSLALPLFQFLFLVLVVLSVVCLSGIVFIVIYLGIGTICVVNLVYRGSVIASVHLMVVIVGILSERPHHNICQKCHPPTLGAPLYL